MKLLQLTVENFRGAPNGTYEFTEDANGAPLGFAVLSGGAASGKSSLLEAIAFLGRAIESRGILVNAARVLRAGAMTGRVATKWRLSETELKASGGTEEIQSVACAFGTESHPDFECGDALDRLFSASQSPKNPSSTIEHLGSNRRLVGGLARPPSMYHSDTPWRIVDSARPDGEYDAFEFIPWLLAEAVERSGSELRQMVSEGGIVLSAERPDPLAAVRFGLSTMLPHLRLADASLAAGRATLHFARRSGGLVRLEQLSDSERQAVLLTVALQWLPFRDSVFLIDCPELQVPAEDQVRFFRGLGQLSGANQLIVATGSDSIAREAGRNVVATLRANAVA